MSDILQKYYRKPGIQVTLPSRGQYYRHDLPTTLSNEIDVFPMTGADEILLHNPDSLINGSAIEEIIKSCCPAIKYPRDLAAIDIDFLMLAIKLASFGAKLEVPGVCPKCQTETKIDLNIRDLLDSAIPMPEPESVRLTDDLVAYVQPYTFETYTILSMKEFEEGKLSQALLNSDLSDEERSNEMSKMFKRITDFTYDILYQSVFKITTPEGEVTDKDQIKNFLKNSSVAIVTKVKESQDKANEAGMPKTHKITCSNEECGHEWDAPLIYDPATFFG